MMVCLLQQIIFTLRDSFSFLMISEIHALNPNTQYKAGGIGYADSSTYVIIEKRRIRVCRIVKSWMQFY